MHGRKTQFVFKQPRCEIFVAKIICGGDKVRHTGILDYLDFTLQCSDAPHLEHSLVPIATNIVVFRT